MVASSKLFINVKLRRKSYLINIFKALNLFLTIVGSQMWTVWHEGRIGRVDGGVLFQTVHFLPNPTQLLHVGLLRLWIKQWRIYDLTKKILFKKISKIINRIYFLLLWMWSWTSCIEWTSLASCCIRSSSVLAIEFIRNDSFLEFSSLFCFEQNQFFFNICR